MFRKKKGRRWGTKEGKSKVTMTKCKYKGVIMRGEDVVLQAECLPSVRTQHSGLDHQYCVV